MKINEVEKLLEVPRATIRFYEKEGLIHPQRNLNTYREYSDSDIELLKKIIVLRKIGVPVEDIKQMLNDALSLQAALSKNMESLYKQMEELKGALKLCASMQKAEVSLDALDEEVGNHLLSAKKEHHATAECKEESRPPIGCFDEVAEDYSQRHAEDCYEAHDEGCSADSFNFHTVLCVR